MLDKKIRKEVTPKRVFSVVKLIAVYNGKLTKESIYNLVQPLKLTDKQDDAKKVISFLIENDMIKENIDGKLELNINRDNFSDIKKFKEYISSNIFKDMKEKSLFYETTAEILSKDIDFYEYKSFEDIAASLKNKNVDKEYILGWRFWAEFLGFGKILNSQFLINPYVRILDRIIDNEEYEGGQYLVSGFISIVKTECPEFEQTISENKIGLSLTLALRTLESLGKIKLNYTKDSTEVWHLYYSAVDKSEITDIEIVREK